jgi:hypothetical protein
MLHTVLFYIYYLKFNLSFIICFQNFFDYVYVLTLMSIICMYKYKIYSKK